MDKGGSRTGIILSKVYACLFVAGSIIGLYFAGETPLAFVYLAVMTLPWSIVVGPLMSASGWFNSGVATYLVFVVLGSINATLVYYAGRYLDSRRA